MAATSYNPLQPRLGIANGEVPEIINFPETAGQTFKAGTPVKLTTTAGTVREAEDGTTGFLGIAMKDASGTTNAAMPVMVCRVDTPIVARVTASGVAALASTLTIGVVYDFLIDGTDFWYSIEGTSGPVVIYEGPVYDVNGDSTVWGNFRLLAGQAGNLDETGA